MIVYFIILLVAFYVGVGLFLETKAGQIVENVLLTIASLPVLAIMGLFKLIDTIFL